MGLGRASGTVPVLGILVVSRGPIFKKGTPNSPTILLEWKALRDILVHSYEL